MNRVAAFVFLAFTLVAAIAVHRHTHLTPCGLGYDRPACATRDSWQDPLAYGIGLLGILVAATLGYVDRRGSLRVRSG